MRRELGVARSERAAIENATPERWGRIPAAAGGVEEWAETAASHKADTDPRIIEQREHVRETMQEQRDLAPTIRGMRLRVQDVLELLASGMSYDDILGDYDELEHDEILAVLEYAALDSSARVRRVVA